MAFIRTLVCVRPSSCMSTSSAMVESGLTRWFTVFIRRRVLAGASLYGNAAQSPRPVRMQILATAGAECSVSMQHRDLL